MDTLRQTGAVVSVTVYAAALDAESKNTSSASVGTLAPVAPPEVADHLDVLLSQFPVFPTQYLLANLILQRWVLRNLTVL